MKNYFRFEFLDISSGLCPVPQIKFGKKSFLGNIAHKPSRQIIYSINLMAHIKKLVINMTPYKSSRTGYQYFFFFRHIE